jgi:hypothetical protein
MMSVEDVALLGIAFVAGASDETLKARSQSD